MRDDKGIEVLRNAMIKSFDMALNTVEDQWNTLCLAFVEPLSFSLRKKCDAVEKKKRKFQLMEEDVKKKIETISLEFSDFITKYERLEERKNLFDIMDKEKQQELLRKEKEQYSEIERLETHEKKLTQSIAEKKLEYDGLLIRLKDIEKVIIVLSELRKS